MSLLPYLVAAWLLLVGLCGVVTSPHLVHLVLSLGVCQASTYVLLLGIGFRTGATAPIVTSTTPASSAFVDPVVQALTLTDVVVEAVIVAVLLALSVQAHKRYGTTDPNELVALRG